MASQRTRPRSCGRVPLPLCLLQGRTDSHAPPEMAAAQPVGGTLPHGAHVVPARPLAKRLHPLPCRRHGRGPLPGRGGGHPVQDAADGRLGGRAQRARPDDRPLARPGYGRLPGRNHGQGKRQGPYPAHAARLAAPPQLSLRSRRRRLKHPHQLETHAHLSGLVRFRLPTRQQAHPHPRAGRAGQVPEPAQGGDVGKPCRKAHHLLEGAQVHLQALDADHGRRPRLDGLYRGSPRPLRVPRHLPLLRGRAAHEVRPDPLAGRRTGPREGARRAAGRVPVRALRRPVVGRRPRPGRAQRLLGGESVRAGAVRPPAPAQAGQDRFPPARVEQLFRVPLRSGARLPQVEKDEQARRPQELHEPVQGRTVEGSPRRAAGRRPPRPVRHAPPRCRARPPQRRAPRGRAGGGRRHAGQVFPVCHPGLRPRRHRGKLAHPVRHRADVRVPLPDPLAQRLP